MSPAQLEYVAVIPAIDAPQDRLGSFWEREINLSPPLDSLDRPILTQCEHIASDRDFVHLVKIRELSH
jgi:hypothetical protein